MEEQELPSQEYQIIPHGGRFYPMFCLHAMWYYFRANSTAEAIQVGIDGARSYEREKQARAYIQRPYDKRRGGGK